MQIAYREIVRRAGICAVMGLGASLGCRNDSTGPAPIDAAHLYYQLTLNHHAITLALTAPYDTITLLATPRSATGTPLADAGTTSYHVVGGDTNLTISPTGVLHAIAPDTGAQVVAAHTIGSYTLTDTAIVNINAVTAIPSVAGFSLRTQPGDSADFTVSQTNANYTGAQPEIIPVMLDRQGQEIPDVAFRLSSPIDPYIPKGQSYGNPYCQSSPRALYDGLDPATGGCVFRYAKPGKMWIHAEATVYGVTTVDSLLYTVGRPLFQKINIVPYTPIGKLKPAGIFEPGDDTVAVGAIVVWLNRLAGQVADVVFDSVNAAQGIDSVQFSQNDFTPSVYVVPSNHDAGNIAAFPDDSVCTSWQVYNGQQYCPSGSLLYFVRARQFFQAGTYRYHSALYGTSGVIHVVPESQVPTISQ